MKTPGDGKPVFERTARAPDEPENLPAHRRPPEHGGTGTDPIWELDVTELGDELVYREDPLMPGVHGFAEPASTTTFAAYESALIATRLP
jgi:hypothetical protein